MSVNITKIGSVTRLLKRSFGRYIRAFAVMVVLGLAGGLFEAIGIATVIPLFAVLTGKAVEGTGRISRLIAWFFGVLHIPLTAPFILGFGISLFIIKGVVQFMVRYLNARTVGMFEERMRRSLFRRTIRAQWPFLLRQKAGHLESILLYDVEMGTSILNTLANTIITITTFAAYTVIAFSLSIRVTFATLVVGGLVFWAFKPVFYRIRKKLSEAAGIQKELNHHVAEHMLAVKAIKAGAIEGPVIAFANRLFARLRKTRVDAARYRQASLAFIEPLGFILIAVVFLLSYQRPGFSIASFAVIMYLIQQMFGYISSVSGQIQNINQFYPYLKTARDWRRRAGTNAEHDAGQKPFTFAHEIAFSHTTFAYRSGQPVLNDFSLAIARGQHLAIIGSSGAGKTTVVDLLLRLFRPQQGQLTVDGVDAEEIRLEDWRRHIGYVPQDALLLNTSIRENIRFYDDRVTEEDTLAAAKDANIYDTIVSLPQGFDTPTGERGVQLSGGQRQRIALARALARRPAILVLDEATSAIDSESELLIRQTITGLRGKTTVIMIAHRLSSIMEADTIAVLEDGKVREQGPPQELAQREGSYLAKLLAASSIEV